ncbi:hypothetical protein G7Y89_g2253 [Cudoniella acicularis]|uniref:Ubiquitin-like domain-containing protein n=1 Tax=Cudoniella acicularis TaxID=354080 RepID=A0A8H4RUV4_9HELO|nr:hypothetical protein G7Y89_g2253 [Cudoniella acicularis]
MADPIAVASAITGLVIKAFTVSKDVYAQAKQISNAPKHIQAISRDLEDFYSILGTLKLYLEDGDLTAGLLYSAGRTNLENALENCLLAFDRTNELVGSFKAKGGVGDVGTWKRIQFSFKSAQTEALRNELAAHKLSLNIAISLVNFLNTNYTNAAARRSEAEISAHLREIEEKLPIILQDLDEIKSSAIIATKYDPDNDCMDLVQEVQVAQVRSYLNRETATLCSFRTCQPQTSSKSPSISYKAASRATSTYHSALAFLPNQPLGSMPENCTQIFVQGPTKQTHVFRVQPSTTAKDLKIMIESRTSVPAEILFFLWAGKVLPNDQTLEDLNIPHDSTLICNTRVSRRPGPSRGPNPDGSYKVFIKTLIGKTFEIKVFGHMTIAEVKRELETQTPFPAIEQQFIFAGKVLFDYATLSDYIISPEATINAIFRYVPLPLVAGRNLLSEGETVKHSKADFATVHYRSLLLT